MANSRSMKTETRKSLSVWTALSIVIGCVIGSGVFVKPGKVLVATQSSSQAILAWVLGGLLTLAGGLTIAEIAFRIPKTGGLYVYMEELFGKVWGFVSGWVQAIIYGPALMSALSLYFGSLFTQFFSLDASMSKGVGFIALFFLSAISAWSTQYSATISNVTTVIKLLPIALIGIFGIMNGNEPIFNVQLPGAGTTAAAGLGAAILATLWAYDGWIQVSNIAGEIENPSKNLPRAIIGGLTAVMIVYVVVNMALFHVLPKDQIATLNERAAPTASEILFGSWGGRLIGLGILVSIFGCLNGNILTMTRVPYAMAARGAFPFADIFSRINPKTGTPFQSIALKVFCACVMMLFLNPDRITDIAIFSMYIFYAVVFLGIFKLRKIYGKPAPGQYSVPFFPVIPVAAFAGCLFICYSMAVNAPLDAIVSLVIAGAGVPVYFWTNYRQKKQLEFAVANPIYREYSATPIRQKTETLPTGLTGGLKPNSNQASPSVATN
jgi:basic amino acid/polyamine antiporter, APA family